MYWIRDPKNTVHVPKYYSLLTAKYAAQNLKKTYAILVYEHIDIL